MQARRTETHRFKLPLFGNASQATLLVALGLTVAVPGCEGLKPAKPLPPKGAAAAKKPAAGPQKTEHQAKPMQPVDLGDHVPAAPEAHAEPFECPLKEHKEHAVAGMKVLIEPHAVDVLKRELLAGRPWEPHVAAKLEAHVPKGGTVVDVGAYIGTHTIAMARKAGPEGRVYAFEPQIRPHTELRCNLALNGIENTVAMRVALGERFGEVEMNVAQVANVGATVVGAGGDKAPLTPLDAYAFERLDLIKIDVGGGEQRVLEGAVRTLQKHKPVVLLEILGAVAWERATPPQRKRIADTAHQLTGLGYKVDRIGPVDYLAVPTDATGKPPAGAPTPEGAVPPEGGAPTPAAGTPDTPAPAASQPPAPARPSAVPESKAPPKTADAPAPAKP